MSHPAIEAKETVFGTRYFIAMGFPGFNSPANNRSGYETAAKALAAHLRYASRRTK